MSYDGMAAREVTLPTWHRGVIVRDGMLVLLVHGVDITTGSG